MSVWGRGCGKSDRGRGHEDELVFEVHHGLEPRALVAERETGRRWFNPVKERGICAESDSAGPDVHHGWGWGGWSYSSVIETCHHSLEMKRERANEGSGELPLLKLDVASDSVLFARGKNANRGGHMRECIKICKGEFAEVIVRPKTQRIGESVPAVHKEREMAREIRVPASKDARERVKSIT